MTPATGNGDGESEGNALPLLIPNPNAQIDLRCQDDIAFLQDLMLAGEEFDMIHMDAPWLYRGGKNNTQRGLAGFHYSGLSEVRIAQAVALTAPLAKPDSYLVFWCTFPKLMEWARTDQVVRAAGWEYVTGGVWGKSNGLGTGYHLRGDAEIILVYKRGKPKALVNNQSDLWELDAPPSTFWMAERGLHSAKPLPVLRDILDVFCPVGGKVLNVYSGEAATMERACRDTGRACVSCEADPERWQRAMDVLILPELFPPQVYSGPSATGQLVQMMMEVGEYAEELAESPLYLEPAEHHEGATLAGVLQEPEAAAGHPAISGRSTSGLEPELADHGGDLERHPDADALRTSGASAGEQAPPPAPGGARVPAAPGAAATEEEYAE